MEDKEMQAKFIQWLAQKTGAKTEQELKQVLMRLQSNQEQMEQVMQEFQAEMAGGQAPAVMRNGGKAEYLKCLSQFKKGGSIGCGCGKVKMEHGSKVPKAFLGAVMGAIKGASAIAKGGTSLAKGANTLAKVGKAAQGIQQAVGVGKQVLGQMSTRPVATSTNSVGVQGYQTMPNINTPTMPTFQVGSFSDPNQVPGATVMYQGNSAAVGKNPNANPMISEKGGKLKAKKAKK